MLLTTLTLLGLGWFLLSCFGWVVEMVGEVYYARKAVVRGLRKGVGR